MNTAELNCLSRKVIGAAIEVHRELGAGLEEPNYEVALSTELARLGISHRRQYPLPVVYKGVRLDAGYRMDLFVEGELLVEVKSVEVLHPVHEAQLLTYLRLSSRKLGLLINFDVPVLKSGIRRKVLRLDEERRVFDPSVSHCEAPLSKSHHFFDDLSHAVLGAAIEVHRHLGPGLLKSAYEECLCYELSTRQLHFERRKPVAIRFREVDLPQPVEVDLIVAGRLPLSVVSIAKLPALYEVRFISQLRLGGWPYGLLLNFGEKSLASGIRRLVNPRFARRR